jgi:N-acetylneuraminic acid mutarotase
MSFRSRLSLSVPVLLAAALLASAAAAEDALQITELAPLEKPVTSFGAAEAGGWLYIYGGQLGSAHKYSVDTQARQLLRLNINQPGKWELVAEGPPRTGLAMVGYEGQIYRIGGWEAKNAAGEKWNLHSSRDFARFDEKSGKWQDLAPMPRGRSSHDAAMLGSKLYVIGGWELAGEGEGDWHTTAYVSDLAAETPEWKEIAAPGFCRRALAVAAQGGKVYAIGGMDDSNETTTAVSVFDPQSNAWSKGPAVPGENFDGFGAAAFGTEVGLFASTRSGAVYRLNDDGQAWTQIGKLNHPRSFHRLIIAEGKLLFVGGTAKAGKVAQVESAELAKK